MGPHGETRDLKNIEYVLSDAVGQHLLGKYWHYTEASSTTATNREPWFPGCPVFDAINKDPTDGCNFIRFHKDCESRRVASRRGGRAYKDHHHPTNHIPTCTILPHHAQC